MLIMKNNIKKTNTSERILDVTQELIQSRGYSAISFNDIAKEVGIKKPSILYHYPSKVALGVAVVARYRKNFSMMLDKALRNREISPAKMMDFYFSPYLDLGKKNEKICLCGALAGEYMALPKGLRDEVTLFLEDGKKWLTTILKLGKSTGDFSFDGSPVVMANLVLDALQGSLIVSRAMSNKNHVKKTIAALKTELGLQSRIT